MKRRTRAFECLAGLALVALLGGCGRGVTSGPGEASNLENWVKEVRARPA